MKYPIRLDLYLVKDEIESSRNRGQRLINSGQVFVNGVKCLKHSHQVEENDLVEVKGEGLKYVSRSGLKLEKAVSYFNIDLSGQVCMDIGASTGGFTQCMLMFGARKIYAVDVGSNQLAQELLVDSRVVNLEKTNIRELDLDLIKDRIDFIAVDVSFISLSLVIPIISMINKNAKVVLLVKPQFEVESKNISKRGIVTSKKAHEKVLKKIYNLAINEGFFVFDITYSPIKGSEGNIEYLVYLGENTSFDINNLGKIILQAFEGGNDEYTINT